MSKMHPHLLQGAHEVFQEIIDRSTETQKSFKVTEEDGREYLFMPPSKNVNEWWIFHKGDRIDG